MGNIEFARSVKRQIAELYRFYMVNTKRRPTNAEKIEYNKYYQIINKWYESEPNKDTKKEFKQILKELQAKDLTLIVEARKKSRGNI